MTEFALSDLFANDIDVKREVDLLNGFRGETRKEANDDDEESQTPETELAVSLGGRFVKLVRGRESGVNASPEPDEKGRYCGDEHYKPIPAESVHQNI